MVHGTEGAERALPYTATELRAFFDAYLSEQPSAPSAHQHLHLAPRLQSELASDMARLNSDDHTLSGHMENIAGSQFQTK